VATERETVKVSLRLFSGDTERLQAYYPKLGYNRVIRTLVAEHLKRLDAKFHETGASEHIDLEIDP